MSDSLEKTLFALETELMGQVSRRRGLELLDPDFEEIGASGRIWTRDDVLTLLAERMPSDSSPSEFRIQRLDDRLVLAIYRTNDESRGTIARSSLWRKQESGWRLRFHQGTPTSKA